MRFNLPQAPTEFGWMVLGALQRKPMYQGTVTPATVQKRRARNRVAAKSRRINRRAS